MGNYKFMTKELEKAFAKQGDTSEKTAEDIKVIAKWFNPTGAGTWWCYEYDPKDEIAQCFVELGNPDFAEDGAVSLDELKSIKLRFGLGIERDIHFPIGKYTLKEVRDRYKKGSPL